MTSRYVGHDASYQELQGTFALDMNVIVSGVRNDYRPARRIMKAIEQGSSSFASLQLSLDQVENILTESEKRYLA